MTKQELMTLGLSEEDAVKVLKEHVPYDRFKQVNDDKKALEVQTFSTSRRSSARKKEKYTSALKYIEFR